MPRPTLIRTDEFPYHVTCRTNNKDWFYVNIEECWEIFSKFLTKISEKYAAKIISFVLMSNHFHMILQTPLSNIDQIMHYLLLGVSKEIGLRSNRINHVFGGRYSRSLIMNDIYLYHAYKYLYRNPVEAMLSKSVEEYRFSTIQGVLSKKSISFPFHDLNIFPCDLIPIDLEQRLNWLNDPYSFEQKYLIKTALKKSIFELPKGKNVAKSVAPLLEFPKRYAVPFGEIGV